ncbi:MFS transporter [Streptomyces sp. NPDC057307]|uniref:MFS transporter n=1 Tax=Streptomyces sp. NPDC057307 TaxID=3346096 RepID=UPI0036321CDD
MTSVDTPPDRHTATGRITFFIALTVFAQESTWNFYDAQVPPMLREHIASAAVVGLVMGMDNLLGIFIQPWMGNRSDNARTRWGRRIPFLAVGMPVAALVFAVIPLASALPTLIAVIFLYAVIANSFKPIGEALLPDFIEPERRSRASAAVKSAAGLTVIVSALLSALLVDDHPTLAFSVPSALMLTSAAVLVWRVRDNRSRGYQLALAEDRKPNSAPATRMPDIIRDILRDRDRSRLLTIVAILLFGGAWAASRALITPYGMETLGLSRGDAGALTLPSGIAFLLAAYPAAFLAERVGRIRTMALGVTLFGAALVGGALVPTPTGTVVALSVGAVGAAGFIINASVVLWNLAPSSQVLGTYTGLYTVGWASGGFIGPALVGAMVDVTGWQFLLADVAVLTALAVAAVLRVATLRRHHDTPATAPTTAPL